MNLLLMQIWIHYSEQTTGGFFDAMTAAATAAAAAATVIDDEDDFPLSTTLHRNFLTYPLTSHEDMALQRAAAAAEAAAATAPASLSSTIAAAVCHPTLFGNISLHCVLSFVSYYSLLGFGHVFFWYEEDSLAWSPNMGVLGNLSYATLTPTSQAMPQGGGGYHGQGEVQRACQRGVQYGALYDWILVVDADEYLWLGGSNTATIQDCVGQHPHITYYSFGKWQYSTNRATLLPNNTNKNAGFMLDAMPFTLGRYCYNNPNADSCPDWIGWSKILCMPSKYPEDIPVHGDPAILTSRSHEAVHYDHRKAHIKEWPGLAAEAATSGHPSLVRTGGDDIYTRRDVNGQLTMLVEPRTFVVSKDVYLGVHWQAEAFPVFPNGTLLVMYDDQLSPWLRRVASNLYGHAHMGGE